MDPDKALEKIRELVKALDAGAVRELAEAFEDSRCGGEEHVARVGELAELMSQLDEWLTKGGLFPARWEDTHGWVRVRRDLADKQRELSKVGEMLHSAQRAVDQLEAGRDAALELVRKRQAVEPKSQFLDLMAQHLGGRT
jgi:hypothetical protein